MKRYFVIIALAQIFGILQSACIKKPAFFIIAEIIAAVIFLRLLIMKRHEKTVIVIAIFFMILGACQYLLDHKMTTDKYVEFFGKKIEYSGYVDSDVEYDSVNKICGFYMYITAKSSLGIKEGKIKVRIENVESQNSYFWGKPISIECYLEKASAGRNPGEFDYSDYLITNRVSATATLDESGVKENVENKIGFNKKNGCIFTQVHFRNDYIPPASKNRRCFGRNGNR